MEFKSILLYVLIGVVIVSIIAPGYIQGLIGYTQPVAPAPTLVPGTTTCADTSVTMTHGQFKAWGTPATSLTLAAGALWFKNGAYQGTETLGATDTVAPGDSIVEIVGSRASTTSSPYSGKAIQVVVPCGSFSLAEKGTSYSIAGYTHQGKLDEMIVNGTMTLDVINGDTGNINAINTENETVGSGETATFTLKLKTSSYQGLSPYGSLVLVIDSNKTTWDNSEFVFGSYPRTTVPSAYIPNYEGAVAQQVAFLIPGCPTAGKTFCDENLGTLLGKAKSTGDPASSSRGGLNLTVYQQDFDLHTQTSGLAGIMFGIEDNAGALSGPEGQTRQISIG